MNELDAYVEVRSSTPAPKRGVTPVCVCVVMARDANEAMGWGSAAAAAAPSTGTRTVQRVRS